MVQVVESRFLENCLDKSQVRELVLSQALDETIMRRMAVEGRLQFFPHFPRPYFRIDRSRTYVVQGVLGNDSVRVTFSPLAPEGAERELCRLIEDGSTDSGGE